MSHALARHTSGQLGRLRLGNLVAAAVVALELYVVVSVFFHPHRPLEYNFLSEHGSITLLSSLVLLIGAGIAVATARITWSHGVRARLMWAGFAVVLLYFSVDEVVGFHEAAGDALDADVAAGPFRNWNDLVVFGYGLVAIPVALVFRREVLRYHRLFTMLAISVVLYVATSSVDALVSDPTPVSIMIEEGIKVHCSVFLMLSALTGLVAARDLARTPRAARTDSARAA